LKRKPCWREEIPPFAPTGFLFKGFSFQRVVSFLFKGAYLQYSFCCSLFFSVFFFFYLFKYTIQ
jgi:hypothetical protein